MTSQVIPAQAVEAALAARREFKNQRGMDNAENLMRHILEAAAPHMHAQAWDEGERAAFDSIDGANRPNPYRPTP